MSLPPPPSRCSPAPFQPAARRHLSVFGAPVELVWLPDRAVRKGLPHTDRPAFLPDRVAAILGAETVWQDADCAVTPNRFPFAREQVLLWPRQPCREPGAGLLALAFAWQAAHGGTLMQNSVGAAASIPCVHVHLTSETLPFLASLPERGLHAGFLPAIDGVRYVQKQVPYCLLGVRGPAAARATAVQALQLRRMTAAANLVVEGDTAWLCPRRVEVPAPHFPYALGGAEVWGRWCYIEEAEFARATGADLEQALQVAAMPALA